MSNRFYDNMLTLSKSKYLQGLQCPKYLWMAVHQPEKIPEVDEAMQYRFDQGHLVTELARKLFPKGIMLPEEREKFKENLEKTQTALKEKKPLFEPGFQVNSLYSRADILEPHDDEWDIIEVKSSTHVEEVNLHDVSFQRHVYQQAGLKIRKCFLLHINNEYIKEGEIEPKELFTKEDITEEVKNISTGIQERIAGMLQMLALDKPPTHKISQACSSPYACPIEECWKFLPEHNVTQLYRIGKKAFELVETDVHALKDIPSTFILNERQGIQHQCAKTGKPYVDKAGIEKFLGKLKEPVHYLDFETFQTAVPLYDGTHPWQQIPFQFSLHVNGEHHSFLAKAGEDPRAAFLKELKKVIGAEGSIVVYNASFEIGRLKELAETFPNYKKWVKGVVGRMVDLIEPFRDFSYYHPSQKGSCSIKVVLPALTGKDYSALEISNGGEASLAFLSTGNDAVVRANLEKYCGLDTEGMQLIVEILRTLVK